MQCKAILMHHVNDAKLFKLLCLQTERHAHYQKHEVMNTDGWTILRVGHTVFSLSFLKYFKSLRELSHSPFLLPVYLFCCQSIKSDNAKKNIPKSWSAGLIRSSSFVCLNVLNKRVISFLMYSPFK